MRQVNASSADTLRAALESTLDGLAPRNTAQAVDRLIAHYRGDTPTATPVLRDRADVVAYAAYRMPATFEAVRAALGALVRALPAGWTPESHLDLGGGTGAAAWAVSATWDGERPVTVLDWAQPALTLGRELTAAHPGLKSAQWHRTRLGGTAPASAGPGTVVPGSPAEGKIRPPCPPRRAPDSPPSPTYWESSQSRTRQPPWPPRRLPRGSW